MNDEFDEVKVKRTSVLPPSILLQKEGSAMKENKSEDKHLFAQDLDHSLFKNNGGSPLHDNINTNQKPTQPQDQNENENLEGLEIDINKTSSVYLSVILNILFIVSFLMEYRITTANKMNFAIQKEIDEHPWVAQLNFGYDEIRNMEGAIFFANNVILINVLNIQRTYVPQNYEYLLNAFNSSNTTNNDLEDLPYYFLNSFNMFKGMLVTCRYIPRDETEEREEEYYVQTNVTLQELSNTFSQLYFTMISGRTFQLKIELIFFNVVDQVGLHYEYHFRRSEESIFKKSRRVQPFYPKTFDSDYDHNAEKLFIILFRVIFALSLLTQIIKIFAVDVFKAIKTLFQTHKLVLPLPILFNLGLTILLIVVVVLSFAQNIKQSGTMDLFGVIFREQFDNFKGFADFNNQFNKLLAITVGLLVVQILLLLNTKFPTFGVLFYTLGSSKGKLLIYGIVILTLMAGFVTLITINFGHGDTDINSFANSIYIVFQFFIGLLNFEELDSSNPSLAKPYFLVFYIVFQLILLQLFYVIIITTYVNLRKKLQLTTLALAELTAEKSNKLKEKYINLILFRPPKEPNNDEEEQKTTSQQQHKKRTFFEILIYNLEEVDWFGLTSSNQQTRDEIEAEIKQKVQEIRERKIAHQHKRNQQRKLSLFDRVGKLIFHLIFVIVFTIMLDLELKTTQSFEMEKTLSNYYTRATFNSSGVFKNFYDISSVEDVRNWISVVYLNGMFQNFSTATNSDPTVIVSLGQNKIVSTAVARITYRMMQLDKLVANENPNYNFWIRKHYNINPESSVSDAEITSPINFTALADYLDIDTWKILPYTQPGDHKTFRKKGGYAWTFLRDRELCFNGTYFVNHPLLLNINTGLISLQNVYMNGDSELLGLTEFVITFETNGNINKQYKTRTFQVNIYSCHRCYWKAILEVIYVLFVLKQTYDLLKEWYVEWKKEESRKYTPFNEALDEKPFPSKLMNYDFTKFKTMSFIWAFGIRVWQTALRLFYTTLHFFKKDYANFILTFSMVLSYTCLSYYFRIITHDIIGEIDLKKTPIYSPDQIESFDSDIQIGKLEELAHLTDSYATIQAFNSWLIIVRIIFELGFVRELSFVLDLIGESLLELLFFVATFAIIVFGFAIDGYLLFGEESQNFRSIGRSFLQVLQFMFAGPNTNDDATRTESVTRALYFVLVIVICLLILLKMFMAILDAQFMELEEEELNENRLGFFELIVQNIEDKMKGQKLENLLKTMPEDASFGTKLKIRSFNFLIRMRFTFVRILRTTIFGEEEEQLTDEEKKKIRKTFEQNKMTMSLKFEDIGEQRMIGVNDINLYLNENQDENQVDIFEFKDKAAKNIEDDLSLSNKWMSYLEETVLNMTNGSIFLSKFGTGAKDYITAEYRIEPEMELKFKQIEETIQKDVPYGTSLIQHFTDEIAIPEYQKKLKLLHNFDHKSFEEIANHLNFIYHHSLTNLNAVVEDEIPIDIEQVALGDESPVEKAFHRETSTKEVKIYKEENFDPYNKNLIKFWDSLKFEHKYELWNGEYSDLLSLSIKTLLWREMKFDGIVFKQYVNEELMRDRCLNPDKIGQPELEYIWNILADMDPTGYYTTTYKDLFEYHDLNINHMKLAEQLIRGNVNNLVLRLKKEKGTKNKIQYLMGIKHTKNDQKLMLWLMSSSNLKMELIMRIRNSILSKFSVFLFLEEVYDNAYLLAKVEDDLDQDMRNKIYMHFFLFSHFEALQTNYKGQKEINLHENDTAVVDYVRFLERQLISTNKTKAFYLDEINHILREEGHHERSPIILPTDNAASDPALSRTLTDNEERENLIQKRRSEMSDNERLQPVIKLESSTIIHRNIEGLEDIPENESKPGRKGSQNLSGPGSKNDLDNSDKKRHPKAE